jgi:hypothetical protein
LTAGLPASGDKRCSRSTAASSSRRAHWSTANELVRPHSRDGVYTAIDVPPYTVPDDHPSMLCALGVIPATGLVEPGVMRATLHRVLSDWD